MQSSSLEQTNPSERSAGQDGDRTAAHPRTTDDHGQSLNKIAGRVAAQCLGCDWRLKELNVGAQPLYLRITLKAYHSSLDQTQGKPEQLQGDRGLDNRHPRTAHRRPCILCPHTRPKPSPQKAEQSAEYVRTDIPKLLEELERSQAVLQDLSDKLPRIRSRITSIQHAYGSGRKKVSSNTTLSSVHRHHPAPRSRLRNSSTISSG